MPRLRQRIETCRRQRRVVGAVRVGGVRLRLRDRLTARPRRRRIIHRHCRHANLAVAIDDGRPFSLAGEEAAGFAVNAWRRLQPLAQLFCRREIATGGRRRTRRRSPVRICGGPRLCFCGRAGSRTGGHHHERHRPDSTSERRNAHDVSSLRWRGLRLVASPQRLDVGHQLPRLIGGQLRIPRRHPVRPPLGH